VTARPLASAEQVTSRQMLYEVLIHLEYGHLVLTEDLLELAVGQDLVASPGLRAVERNSLTEAVG
jgi:hypothetical protein